MSIFIAIERTTRLVFHRVMPAKRAECARRLLKYLAETSPLRVQKILTDNGKEFTDRLFGSREKAASGGTSSTSSARPWAANIA